MCFRTSPPLPFPSTVISIAHPLIRFPIFTHMYSYRLTVLHLQLIHTPAGPADLSRKKSRHSRSILPSLTSLHLITAYRHRLHTTTPRCVITYTSFTRTAPNRLPSLLPFPLNLHCCSPPTYVPSNTSQNSPITCSTPSYPTTPPASTDT